MLLLPDVFTFAPDYAPYILLALIGLFAIAILGYSIQDREDTKQKGQLEIERLKLEADEGAGGSAKAAASAALRPVKAGHDVTGRRNCAGAG